MFFFLGSPSPPYQPDQQAVKRGMELTYHRRGMRCDAMGIAACLPVCPASAHHRQAGRQGGFFFFALLVACDILSPACRRGEKGVCVGDGMVVGV